jgi:hypothetical protein
MKLIEQGIEARQQKEKAFFQLAERFRAADDPEPGAPSFAHFAKGGIPRTPGSRAFKPPHYP